MNRSPVTHSALVIGLGRIGLEYDLHLDPDKHVYSHARALSLQSDFRLLGAVDPDRRKRGVFSETFDVPAYADLETAFELHQPEVVVIAVPTRVHSRILHRVLELSTPRAVLCEKPLSYDVGEAQAMVQSCAERDVKLFVNYVRRSDPGAIEIKRRILAGELGSPIKGVAWYSKGFLHNGSHLFNLLEFWLGPARNSVVLSRGRPWDGADAEPDVEVRFDRGRCVFLGAWEEAFSHYTIELLSPNGRLRYEQGGEAIQWCPVQDDPHFQDYVVLSTSPEDIASGMDRYQMHVAEQLAAALSGRDAELCTGLEALRTLEAMNEILDGN